MFVDVIRIIYTFKQADATATAALIPNWVKRARLSVNATTVRPSSTYFSGVKRAHVGIITVIYTSVFIQLILRQMLPMGKTIVGLSSDNDFYTL